MSFLLYDLTLLALFIILLGIFLYIRRKKIKKEGLLLLYRTGLGIKIINYIGNKYKKTLKVLSYVVIFLGYLLMAGIIYLAGKIVWLYIFRQDIVQIIKVPPVMPLIPYLPQIFKLNFLPDFTFIYWIVIIAVIAITHEMAHGIMAAYNKIKIKSTGFGFFPFFLPVFLAAFVELDEKKMAKKSKLSQMAVLSAGTFANVIVGVFFFFVMWLFFSFAFSPVGVVFDSYAYSSISISEIVSVNDTLIINGSYNEISSLVNDGGFTRIKTNKSGYLTTKNMIKSESNKELAEKEGYLILYDDAPAVNSNLSGAISEINEVKIDSKEKLSEVLSIYEPGDKIVIKTINDKKVNEHEIVLEEHPDAPGEPWLGIGFISRNNGGIIGSVVNTLSSFKDPHVYYEASSELNAFIYNLLWWLVLICFSVALINMLPVGIFDGGRFFYLTILGLTGSETKAKKAFSFLTYFFLFLLFVMMFFWALSFF